MGLTPRRGIIVESYLRQMITCDMARCRHSADADDRLLRAGQPIANFDSCRQLSSVLPISWDIPRRYAICGLCRTNGRPS